MLRTRKLMWHTARSVEALVRFSALILLIGEYSRLAPILVVISWHRHHHLRGHLPYPQRQRLQLGQMMKPLQKQRHTETNC